ncbi:uncharacterized protein HMPREF1541_09208 [Cyphellophora europaea CBS 101466]|uniref:Uncharacterized protein n=1 Tax=Cyphellophora europaea (strain CBS 101466) TaxID=1220924 RepID=W2S9P1_CYPE1|nr:uncharacterized protein HMPREF1541_09208 [Cyphellophora europaea CBS 101466]ETN45377.1 hypothetical protein HMPREF1541_09208 [Cyphellophora europaea CBS 101466]
MVRATSHPSQLSEEFINDSSDEADEVMSGVDQPAAISRPTTNGSKVVHDVASEAGSSESESADSQDESRNDDSAATDTEISRNKKRSSDQVTLRNAPPAKRTKKRYAQSPRQGSHPDKPSNFRIPAKPYRAPKGFEPLQAEASDLDFEPLDNLDDKQVWHITAPASLDLTQIKQLDVAAALRGEPILDSGGISYSMQPSSEQAEVLLLPRGESVVYQQKTKISRAFQLRYATGIDAAEPPTSKAGPPPPTNYHFTAQEPGTAKPVRKQPENLNYRYLPFGVKQISRDVNNSVDLAESILIRAASSKSGGDLVGNVENGGAEKKKKKEKRGKLSKATGEPAI